MCSIGIGLWDVSCDCRIERYSFFFGVCVCCSIVWIEIGIITDCGLFCRCRGGGGGGVLLPARNSIERVELLSRDRRVHSTDSIG